MVALPQKVATSTQWVLLSQVFYPDQQATSALLSPFIARLARQGWRWQVLAGFPSANRDPGAVSGAETWNGIRIVRGGLKLDGKQSMVARALVYASFSLWSAWRLLSLSPAKNRVVVVTNPPFAPVLVWLCSRLRRWDYEVILHDVYPDGLISLGNFKAKGPVARVWRALNRRALGGAARVFVLGRDMAALIRTRYGVQPGRIVYFPNWSPTESDPPAAESTALWDRLGLHGKFVVQYSGNMGLWHDMISVVRAAELLRDRADIVFLLIGDGRRRAAAKQLADELRLPNLVWLPFQPQAELRDSLACCHVAIVSQRDGLEGIAVPSKLYGILGSGRAILAQVPQGSEAALVVGEETCGLVISPGSAHFLADAITDMARHRERTRQMGERAFAAYQARYTLEAAVARFEQAMMTSRVS